MKRLLTAFALAAAALAPAAAPRPLAAQVVEQPEAFDAAGRVSAITPAMAARLGLTPPAWRVTGDFVDARLFKLGDGGWVLAVRRPDGTVERYSLTAEERAELGRRVATLPSSFELTQLPARVTEHVGRNAFIRNQTLLGLAVYGPGFAYAVSNNSAGRVASWLLASGATFFTAAEVSRQIPIDAAQNRLATLLAVHGGAAGYGLAYALDANSNGRGAGVLVGGVAGTALGIAMGQGMTDGQVEATTFGAEVSTLVATAYAYGNGPTHKPGGGGDEIFGLDVPGTYTRGEVAAMVGAGLVGYPLGAYWAKTAPYHITAGDVLALWPAAAVGAATGYTVLGNGDARPEARAAAFTGGALAGIVAGDYFLVQQYDHSRYDAGLVALGTGAGALMGAGVSRVIDQDGSSRPVLTSLLAVGGAAGLLVTERIIGTPNEGSAPRTSSRRWELSPSGLAMAAAGVKGDHSLLTLKF